MQHHTVSEFFLYKYQLKEKTVLWNQTLIHLSQVFINIGYLELNSSIVNILR